MNNLVKMSEVYEEICTYKEWVEKYDVKYESHLTLLEKKYRTILRKVVFRDVKQFKIKRDNCLKKVDAPIIREILIMATPGKGNDKNCTRWLNGKLEITDYEATAELFDNLMSMLERLQKNEKIDEDIFYRWYAVLNTILHGESAKRIIEIKKAIDKLFNNSVLLNNCFDMKLLRKIDDYGSCVPVFKVPEEELYIGDLSIEEITKYMMYQYQYFDFLLLISEYFSDWADNVSDGLQNIV